MEGCTCTDDVLCDLCAFQRDWIGLIYQRDLELTRVHPQGDDDDEQRADDQAA